MAVRQLTRPVLLPLVLLTIAVGAAFPLGQVAWQCGHRLGLRLNLRHRDELAQAAATATPRQLADPGFIHDLEGAQLATTSIGAVPQQSLQLVATVITSVALCASIMTISPPAGPLVAAALLPTVLAFTMIARVELAGLPGLTSSNRRATYLTEQLLQRRTGTELATLQSGHKIARLADQSRRDYFDILDCLTRFGTRMELACASVISGIHAIRSSGNAFGQLVTAAPKVALFDTVIAGVTTSTWAGVVPRVEHLKVTDLHHTYPGASRPALDGVSFEVRRGQMIGLVGVNGAGKTTAVNIVLGSIATDGGRVEFDGLDAATIDEAGRLAAFGLLTQEFGRYELTCRDTVALGCPEEVISNSALWRALDNAHTADFVRELPHGLDTQLGQQWGGSGLSGGGGRFSELFADQTG